jgi:cytochrome c-type biogenesis protein CcmH/NrfG
LELVDSRPVKQQTALHIFIGVLVGFVGGYLAHEVMVVRQPVRLVHGEGGPTLDPTQPAPMPQAPAPAPGGAPGGMEDVQRLRDHVANNPNDAEAVVQLAAMNYMIRNWTRAAELFEHYLTLKPEGPQALDVMSDLGACYRELQQPDRALEMFSKVTAKAPEHWQAKYNQVMVLAFDLKRFDQAEQVLADLKRLQPQNADVAELAAAVARQRANPS